MVYVMEFLHGWFGDYGVAVAVATLAAFMLLIPLKILAARNNEIKTRIAPDIKAIKDKYGINAIGGSYIDEKKCTDAEILAMSASDREDRAAEEIDAVYKKNKYRPFTAWLPFVAEMIFIVLLYYGITRACPEGQYRSTFSTGGRYALIYCAAYLMFTILNCGISIYRRHCKEDHTNSRIPLWLIDILSAVLSIGICIWICSRASAALLIGIIIIRVGDTLFNELKNAKNERAVKNGNKADSNNPCKS